MKLPKIKIQEKLKALRKLPWIIGKRIFIFLMLSLLFNFILGGFLFYKYSILASKETLDNPIASLQFQENIYKEVIQFWQEREIQFKSAESAEYPDLFR